MPEMLRNVTRRGMYKALSLEAITAFGNFSDQTMETWPDTGCWQIDGG